MTFYQNGYYELLFPITDDSEQPIPSVKNATFTLTRLGAEVVSLSICNGKLAFSGSVITATLDDTSSLDGDYKYELWILTDDDKRHLMRADTIKFIKTTSRIIPC